LKGVIIMDTNELIQLVSNIGYPIVVSLVLFKMFDKTLKDLKESIDNNTKVIEAMKQGMSILIGEVRNERH